MIMFHSHRLFVPLSPSLFPYTTLFRSLSVRIHGEERGRLLLAFREVDGVEVVGEPAFFQPDARAHSVRGSGGMRDRKSTRLNSSHTVISYAVFCLKEKKIQCDQ